MREVLREEKPGLTTRKDTEGKNKKRKKEKKKRRKQTKQDSMETTDTPRCKPCFRPRNRPWVACISTLLIVTGLGLGLGLGFGYSKGQSNEPDTTGCTRGNVLFSLSDEFVVLQEGSNTTADWRAWQSDTLSPINRFYLPSLGSSSSSSSSSLVPSILFETERGTAASSVFYQEVTPCRGSSILSFDWFALSGTSMTALTPQSSLNFLARPNFQFRVDLFDLNVIESTLKGRNTNILDWFGLVLPNSLQGLSNSVNSSVNVSTAASEAPLTAAFLETLIPPVVSGGAQVDFSETVVVQGANRAQFDLTKYIGRKLWIAFRVASSSCVDDALLVGLANLQMSSSPSFGSGFVSPSNGVGSTTCPSSG